MDYVNYSSDEDSCVVDDVDLEECDRPQETDLPPVNDLEFIASMAADFTYDYGNIQPTSSLLAPAASCVAANEDSDSGSDSDSNSDNGDEPGDEPLPADAVAEQSGSDSSDSEEDVAVITRKGYQKASRQVTMLTEEEEEGGPSGPLKTKHEIEEVIEPVNPDLLTIEDTSSLVCIGEVKYRIDHECVVVIQADYTTSPLNEGSLLCNVDGKVLGKVQEVFGPITTPFYTVRWKNVTPVAAGPGGKNQGTGAGKNAKGGKGKKGKKGPAGPAGSAGSAAGGAAAGEGEDTKAASSLVEGAEPSGDAVKEEERVEEAVGEANMEVVVPAAEPAESDAEPKTASESADPTVPPATAAGLEIADVRALFPVGAKLFSAPQHSSYVMPGQLRALKGSDASNAYDEEPGADEVEYSDDEQEMLARQARKQEKRAAAGGGAGTGGVKDAMFGGVGDRIPTGYEMQGGAGRGGAGRGRGRGTGTGGGSWTGAGGRGGSAGRGGGYGAAGAGAGVGSGMFPGMPMQVPGMGYGGGMAMMPLAQSMGYPMYPQQQQYGMASPAPYMAAPQMTMQPQWQPQPPSAPMPQQQLYPGGYPMAPQQAYGMQQPQGFFPGAGMAPPPPAPLPRYQYQPIQYGVMYPPQLQQHHQQFQQQQYGQNQQQQQQQQQRRQ